MADEDLEVMVADELSWDPKVDGQTIAVCVDKGAVTLRGTVASFRQKREAQKAAQPVHGVRFVNNELDVRILNEHRREDAHLRADVLQALMLDSVVPNTVDATVKDGCVTLTGVVSWRFQRDEAESIVANVAGVTDVRNEVYVASPCPDLRDVTSSIQQALQRDATIEARGIDVEALNGTVRLTGTVGSWAERDAAIAAAWAAPGVSNVDDHLRVRH